MLPGAGYVLLALQVCVAIAGLFSLVHAIRQRPDAFTAADKLTKNKWLAIVGVGTAVVLVQVPFLWLIGVVAIGVYLADVRPKVEEVQRPRW
ncbi:DUF2516 family protein [Rhodococcus sp. X156]|uniref:DUF2516 family protein n=1 Tax=Rhodococcus sp. X156 TaxID=2499145 RepID=UPI000FDB5486|nr:DUF2516 family protein [Rhodococcus sp. X156]